jgi:hypothetical protein
MMVMNHDRAVQWEMCNDAAIGRAKVTINLPADRVLADSAMIDQVIALVFDHLAQGAVELRVRTAEPAIPGAQRSA